LRAAGHRVLVSAFDADGLAIDILVNNAGIQFRKPMLDLAAADWRRVLETNLTSAFIIGREAARRMIDRKQGGKIINIGSLTSEVARATVAPYTAAKGARDSPDAEVASVRIRPLAALIQRGDARVGV
jgi:NAD(P)-dependent dehydrogenase (short-subunit alcohol dehydrogenase family)